MKCFRLYTEIMDDPKVSLLSDRSFRILIGLFCLTCEVEKSGCLPYTDDQLRWRLRCRMDHLKNTLKQLQELNIIEEVPDGYKVTNWDKRQFKSDNSYERVKRFRNVSVTANETLPEQSRTDTDFPCTQNNPIFKDKHKIKKPFQYTDEFNLFWNAYPNKVGKGKAFEEWTKGNGRPDVLEIVASIERQKGCDLWTRDNGQYIPNPATWLHQRRWDDVPRSDPYKGKVSDKTAKTLANLDAWEERHNDRQEEIP